MGGANMAFVWSFLVAFFFFLSPGVWGEAPLFVSNGTNILRMYQDQSDYDSIFQQLRGKIMGLAADVDDELLFWADSGTRQHAIFSSNFIGGDVTIIVNDVLECAGLSVDWVSKHLYWTDAGHHTLEIANYDGSGRRILIGDGLVNPRGIVVDAVFSHVFWADQGTKTVERASLDGSNRRVIVDKDVYWPNQMAISYSTRRLYWVDAEMQTIMSCDFNGDEVTKERDLVEVSEGKHAFGLVVIGNKAVVSTWSNSQIASTYVATQESFWKIVLHIKDSPRLYSLVSTATTIQPTGFHPCVQVFKGGCTHLCLPTVGPNFKCACPSYGGLALSFNAKSCEAPSELLFFTLTDSGEVGFISLRGAQSPYLTLAGRSSKPSAVTYDPIEQVVYWSDLEESVIYKSSLASKGDKQVFLNGTDGIATVEGLALDWISRQLYFTNSGQSNPGLDGSVYSWHRIEKISLQRDARKTVVSSLDRPRGVALDLDNGLLFYGDLGKQPRIYQANLDGSNAKVIMSQGLSDPHGLTFHDGKLYVADTRRGSNKTRAVSLMIYEVQAQDWTQLKLSANVSLPMGLAIQGDNLYYSDWVSHDTDLGYVKSYNLRFGVDNTVILSGKRPTGLHYSPLARRRKEPSNDVCDNTACSDACIRMPANSSHSYRCSCPDQSTKLLASNNATCARPQNFLMVADLNTIKMISLDDDTELSTHTLLYSDVASNFVALTYDQVTDTVYWSDHTRRSIYFSAFQDFRPQLVYRTHHYIDGLVVDTDKQRLFWTGYSEDGQGVIARINLQRGEASYHEILTGLHSPRAIHLYLEKKLIFWTEYGGKTGRASVNKAKTSGRHMKMLFSAGLYWPNALATHDKQLFIADGAGKVIVTNFNGENQQELIYLSGPDKHIFGLVVMDTVLFYSDRLTNSLYMVDRQTGHAQTLLAHLSRPTSIVVYHPSNLTASNQCMKEGRKCTEKCVPVPKSFHCTCAVGSKLASDGFTCIKLVSPWEITEDSRCPNHCHEDAYCSQLVPLLTYRCVCKTGYEGDGFHCSECGDDFIKPLLGNDTCFPCPLGSNTKGSTTASQCTCNDPSMQLVNGVCSDVTTTTTTTTIATTTNANGSLSDDTTMTYYTDDSSTTDYDDFTVTSPTPPYFENCPHGEIMTLKLPESSDRIWLPVLWTARDYRGRLLPSISNFQEQDNKILIPWNANRDSRYQTVVFAAEDHMKRKATCQFQVLLEDLVPPSFPSCPQNIVRKTSSGSESIDWLQPVAVDNVKRPKVKGSHQSGSQFPVGTTVVEYLATDEAGNTATCVFNVTLLDERPCNLTEFKDGLFVCGQPDKKTCHVKCKPGYIINPLAGVPESFNCETDENRMDEIVDKNEICLRKKLPTLARQQFALVVEGHCRPNSTDLKKQLRTEVLDKLKSKSACRDAECTHGDLTLICFPKVKKRRFAMAKFNMTWNITIELLMGLSPEHVRMIVRGITLHLSRLVNNLGFYLDSDQYKMQPGSVSLDAFQWLCYSGQMVFHDGCVSCPAGSFLNETKSLCQLCAAGNFQNASGQEFCYACPSGFTVMEKGAVRLDDCKTFPPINEMTKFFIIGACSIAVIFLCVVILMYLQLQHQRKKAKGGVNVSKNARHLTPNVYAQAPTPKQKCPDYIRTNNRDFFLAGHDYEDLDSHGKSSFETFSRRPPGCRDSLSSFKATTDMTFLPSPSNGPNSYRASDETILPNSPRESNKSLNIYTDSYPYAMSPNGTMGSFKSSPPPSPYRSLHLAANGPIPKGAPDSPTNSGQTMGSLIGEESPYTSRLIRDRLIDPDSPYRIISHERRGPSGAESPYRVTRRLDGECPYSVTPDRGTRSPDVYRMPNKESPYRSPACMHRDTGTASYKTTPTPELHRARGLAFSQVTDSQHSLRSVPESPNFQRQISLSREDPSAFMPVGDFLYKRPPSPLSPPISSRKSNDSLQRSPSTPRASPGMSRKRVDGVYRSPPMTQKKRVRNEFGLYEYE